MANIWIINQYATTPDFGFGGRWYYFSRELKKLDHDVTLITSSFHHLQHKTPKTAGIYTKLHSCEVDLLLLKTLNYKHAHDKKRAFNWLLFMLQLLFIRTKFKKKPDVIIYSSPSLIGYLGALFLARRYKAKLIFDVRDIWPLSIVEIGHYKKHNIFIKCLSFIETLAYQKSDYITSCLEKLPVYLEELQQSYENFLWLPNGVDLDGFKNQPNINETISTLFSKLNDKFIVGYLGTIGVANAIDNLIDAATILKDNDKIAFVLVGSGKEALGLYQICQERGLVNIHFLDLIPKDFVPSVIKKFDVSFASIRKNRIYEYGISLQKIPEYMVMAKPVLCTYSGKASPLFNVKAGLFVEPDDPYALAHAIKKLQEMPVEELDEMGKNGQKFVNNHLSYSKLVLKLQDVILKL